MFNNLLKIFFISFILSTFASCGVKSPPLPPIQFKTPSIVKINHTIEGDYLRIEWAIPESKEFKETSLDFFNVYKASYSKESFCKKCPVKYSKVAEVDGSINFFNDTLKTDRYYFYKISVVADNGLESKFSKIINFDF